MKIADNVEMLEVENEHGALYPILTWDKKEIVLIDTGLPGQIELIRESVSKAGFSLEKVTKVIITHHDMDHIGCAKILAEFGAEILAHEIEAPYIQGDKTSLRIVDMEKRLHELNEGERLFYEQVKKGAPYFYAHVDKVLKDNETLGFCGGIKVIHTPGHMPGHISLLLKQSNIVVAGDAANIINGVVTGAEQKYSQDMLQAQASFEKIMDIRPASIVCYHGGLYVNESV